MFEDMVAASQMADGAPRLHGKDRRHRLLLRGRRLEYAGSPAGRGPGGGGALLWLGSHRRGRPKDQGGDSGSPGELDTRLASAWPAYDQALKAADIPHEGYIYPGAVHGFNCDATPERYNKAAADLAWQRTIDWFNKYLRS